ncbi:MAG: hypothetical protein ACRD6X_17935 [Pyrinomonadaceae bacterium]
MIETPGRGAVTNYTYENASGTPKRPLVTGISWTVPGGSGIADPADVWAWFTATADGYSGYIPTNANYIGLGRIDPIGRQQVSNYELNRERQALARLNGIRDLIISGEYGVVLAGSPAIGPGVPSNIRQLVSDLAKRPDCALALELFMEALRKFGKQDSVEKDKTFIESVFDNLKLIEINPGKAGSGARSDGEYIFLHEPSPNPNRTQAGYNAFFTSFVLNETVHAFRVGGVYGDDQLDKAAKSVIQQLNPAIATKIQSDFAANFPKPNDGNFAHVVIKEFCKPAE